MVDVDSGITSMDSEISGLLRKIEKPVFLVVNKVDNSSRMNDINEFYSMGIKKLYPIASSNGFGTGELLDDVVKLFKEEKEIDNDVPKFAVVGRPNAGKSSFINALIVAAKSVSLTPESASSFAVTACNESTTAPSNLASSSPSAPLTVL